MGELGEGDKRARTVAAALVVWTLLTACGPDRFSATATATNTPHPTMDVTHIQRPAGDTFPTQEALQTPEVFETRMEMIPADLISSTVKIEMLDGQGGVLAQCSGGVVKGGTLFSAMHCFWEAQTGGEPPIPLPFERLRISQPHLQSGVVVEVERDEIQVHDSFVGDMWVAKSPAFDIPGALPKNQIEYGWMPPLGAENAVPIYSLGFPVSLGLLEDVPVMPVIGRAYNPFEWPEGVPPQFETIETAASGGNSGGFWMVVEDGTAKVVSTMTHGAGRNDPIPEDLRVIVEN